MVKRPATVPADGGRVHAWRVTAMDTGLLPSARLGYTSAGVPPDVIGDPDLGAFVGTGALLLPGGFDGDSAVRQDAAACPDCEWRMRPNCRLNSVDLLCEGAKVGCPTGQIRYQILLRRPPALDFAVVGTVCLGSGQQLRTADQLAQDVRDRFVEFLPAAHPGYQPADGALVNLPALFAAHQDATMGPVNLALAGYAVRLTGTATWRWDFDDGTVLVTDRPGGVYPDRSVQHTYLHAGRRSVVLTTSWTGEFTVDGAGPFPVAGAPVDLTANLAVDVKQAGARLVAPR